MSTKQVIVIRKDLKMRRGKEISQGNHGTIAWIVQRIKDHWKSSHDFQYIFTPEEQEWMFGSSAKITLQVNSEQELLDIYDKCLSAGLKTNLIIDAGKTEFNGVPTKTCLAIGPDNADRIDLITKDLKLY